MWDLAVQNQRHGKSLRLISCVGPTLIFGATEAPDD